MTEGFQTNPFSKLKILGMLISTISLTYGSDLTLWFYFLQSFVEKLTLSKFSDDKGDESVFMASPVTFWKGLRLHGNCRQLPNFPDSRTWDRIRFGNICRVFFRCHILFLCRIYIYISYLYYFLYYIIIFIIYIYIFKKSCYICHNYVILNLVKSNFNN